MKLLWSLLLFLLWAAPGLRTQDTTDYAPPAPPKESTEKRPFKDRIWYGGGIGLNFGTVTSVQLEPMVGYKVDHKGKFSVGPGITWWYLNDGRYTPRYEFNAYGYRLFARYRVIPQAYVHTEFLHMNAQRWLGADVGVQRIWVPHLLAGAGYAQPLGGRNAIYLQVLWEVLQNPNSVYYGQGPIISGGVGLGF